MIRTGCQVRYVQQAWIIALLVGLASLLQAQSTDTCENRTVAVNVRDHKGMFVAGLSPSSFQAQSQSHPVAVSAANVGSAPRILLLLKASGSIGDSPQKWQVEKLIAGSVLSSSHGNANVALALFASEIVESVDFSNPPESTLRRIQQLSDIGELVPKRKRQTALYDSLLQSLGLFATPVVGDAVYIVSDAGEGISRASSGEVERALLARGVRAYVFMLHTGYLYPEEAAVPTLAHFAEVTGGRLVYVQGVGPQLEADLKGAFDQTTQFYSLQLALRTAGDKELGWSLEVVDDKGKRRKDVILDYPHKLPACSLSTGKLSNSTSH
jgi:hypothetical protein